MGISVSSVSYPLQAVALFVVHDCTDSQCCRAGLFVLDAWWDGWNNPGFELKDSVGLGHHTLCSGSSTEQGRVLKQLLNAYHVLCLHDSGLPLFHAMLQAVQSLTATVGRSSASTSFQSTPLLDSILTALSSLVENSDEVAGTAMSLFGVDIPPVDSPVSLWASPGRLIPKKHGDSFGNTRRSGDQHKADNDEYQSRHLVNMDNKYWSESGGLQLADQGLDQEPALADGIGYWGWRFTIEETSETGLHSVWLMKTMLQLCKSSAECITGVLGFLKAVLLRLSPDDRKVGGALFWVVCVS